MRYLHYIVGVLEVILCSIFLCSCESTGCLKEELCVSMNVNYEDFETGQFHIMVKNNTSEDQILQLEWIWADGVVLHPLWMRCVSSNQEAEFQISVRKKAIPKDCEQLYFHFTVRKDGTQINKSFEFVFSQIEEIKKPFLQRQKGQQKIFVSC